jgi:outer membrane protein assembly factor BamB
MKRREFLKAAGAAVADGVVYAAPDDGTLRAFDASNGKLLWEFKHLCPNVTSPAIADGFVLFAGTDGRLYALGPAGSEATPGDAPQGPADSGTTRPSDELAE